MSDFFASYDQKVAALVQFLTLLGKPVGFDQLRAIFPQEGWHEIEKTLQDASDAGKVTLTMRMNGKGSYQEIALKEGA